MSRFLRRHKVVVALFAGAAALVLGGWLWAAAALQGLTQPLIVRFDEIEGVTQTAGMQYLHGLGSIGMVLLVVNFLMALELERRDWFWGKLVAASALVVAVLIFIAFASIISIN